MALRRVLFAVAAAVPSVGYCQGINFIAGKCMHFSACPPPSPPPPPPPSSRSRRPSPRVILRRTLLLHCPVPPPLRPSAQLSRSLHERLHR
jgi:hypothetical protein